MIRSYSFVTYTAQLAEQKRTKKVISCALWMCAYCTISKVWYFQTLWVPAPDQLAHITVQSSQWLSRHEDVFLLPAIISIDVTAANIIGIAHSYYSSLYISSEDDSLVIVQRIRMFVQNDNSPTLFSALASYWHAKDIFDEMHFWHSK